MEHRDPKKEKSQYQNKSHRVLQETKPLEINRCKFKNEASISEVLALFNCSSGE